MRVVVVGPCGSGKSTLVARLQASGYDTRAVAQEHSVVHDLWQHGGMPDALIYLDATPMMISARRRNEFPAWLYKKQQQRLHVARQHATLYLHTDQFTPEQVHRRVLEHLRRLQS